MIPHNSCQRYFPSPDGTPSETKKSDIFRCPISCSRSIFALTSGLSLFLTFYAGFLIMFTATDLSHDTSACAFPFEAFKGAIQRLAFANTNFRHFFTPPCRIIQTRALWHEAIIKANTFQVNRKTYTIFSASCVPPMTCMCRCCTVCAASFPVLMIRRYPLCATSRACAIFLAVISICPSRS